MNPPVRWLLLASILLNLGLVAHYAIPDLAPRAFFNPANSLTSASAHATATENLSGGKSASIAQLLELTKNADPVEMARRLRAAGLPTEIVQALVRDSVHREFAERRARIWLAVPYWKQVDRGAIYELDAQEQRRLRAIMGAELVESPDERAQRERLYGRIPPEKIVQVEKLARDYDELMAKLLSENPTDPGAPPREALRLMRAERQRDLAALLTPEELDDLNARRSEASTTMMQMSGAFEMTESEFRALANTEEVFLAQLDPLSGPEPAASKKYLQARDAQLAEIQRTLGPERYEKYLEATDPIYRSAHAFAQDTGLPTSISTSLWQIDRNSNARAGEICFQYEHDAVARNAALAKLREETRQSALALLTPEQLDAFHKRGGAMWLTLPTAP